MILGGMSLSGTLQAIAARRTLPKVLMWGHMHIRLPFLQHCGSSCGQAIAALRSLSIAARSKQLLSAISLVNIG